MIRIRAILLSAVFLLAGAGWSESTDQMAGGASVIQKEVVSGGAGDSGKSLFATRLGRMPAPKSFTAGPEWQQVTVPFSDLGLDGSDILGIFVGGGPALGTFRFQIDDVRLVPK